jgi:hypothetical protein
MSVKWAVSADLGDEAPISARAEIRLRDRAERIRTRKYPRGLERDGYSAVDGITISVEQHLMLLSFKIDFQCRA